VVGGSYLRLIDYVYHSTLGLGVIKQKKTWEFPFLAISCVWHRSTRESAFSSCFRVEG